MASIRASRAGLLPAIALVLAMDGHRVLAAPASAAPRDDAPRPMAEPAHLAPVDVPEYGTRIVRITGAPGDSTSPVPGLWGRDARHKYSTVEPWNADGTLVAIENREGGSPSPLILDGDTFAPRLGRCDGDDLWDWRWHPSPAHPHEQINVNKAGNELMWFDVTTCTKTRSWRLPITVDYGIGSGEGNPSNDGRFVALGNDTDMFVVDMDPRPPFAPWPSRRIGPVYHFPPESLSTDAPGVWTIGNLSISPSGKYVDVKFSTKDPRTEDAHRIFEVDATTLALRPHDMAAASLRCGDFQSRPNGWIYPLKHADLGLDPFDHDEDVIVGGRSCPGSDLPHVVMVRLRDGQVTPLSPKGDAPVYHVSLRNQDRPGWAYVGFYDVPDALYRDEIVSFKLDGSGAAERWCRARTSASGCYRCEAHPVPSRDGRRVMFASNWTRDCGSGCGSRNVVACYVVSRAAAHDSLSGRVAAPAAHSMEKEVHP